jgi:hypothetical protein
MARTREIIERELDYEKGALKSNALSKCLFCNDKDNKDQYTTQGTYVSTKVTCRYGYFDILSNPYAGDSGKPNHGNSSCPKLKPLFEKIERLERELKNPENNSREQTRAKQEHNAEETRRISELARKSESERKEKIYTVWLEAMRKTKSNPKSTSSDFRVIISHLRSIKDYKDSSVLIEECENITQQKELKESEENRKKKEEQQRIRAEKEAQLKRKEEQCRREEEQRHKKEKQLKKEREEEMKKWKEQGLCRLCGGKLGILKKCKSCGEKNK